ncbi:hypothetical protein L6471_03150 [Segatella bryantii]|nr:hypothetical protein [Segatella bryantii]UKK74718.1 hypothetical protein L6471_03150 [Segatella bryantii]
MVDGQDKTMSIDFFNYNTKTKVYSVRYHGNPTFYHYEWHRVKWIKQAKIFEGEKHKVIYKGKLLQNIEYISFFLVNGKKYFHVKFNNGKILPMCGLETVKQCLKDKHSREVFTYLMEIASCNHLGLSKITNDEDQEAEDNLENNNILLNYYNDIKEKGIERCFFKKNIKKKKKPIHLKSKIGLILVPHGYWKQRASRPITAMWAG